jgi:murein L,D-transpeptidase YafK
MTNPIIEEIFVLASAAFNNGQKSIPVHIFPFRMTDENMNQHKSSEWMDFWNNLRDGHEFFEENHIPPSGRSEE